MIKWFILTCCLILIPQRGVSKDEDVPPSLVIKSALNEDSLSIYHAAETAFSTKGLDLSDEEPEDEDEEPIAKSEDLIFFKDGTAKPKLSTKRSRFFRSLKSDKEITDEEASKDLETSNKTQSEEDKKNYEKLMSPSGELQEAVDYSKDPAFSHAFTYSTEENPLHKSLKATASKDPVNSKLGLQEIDNATDDLAKNLRDRKERRPENVDIKPNTFQNTAKGLKNASERQKSMNFRSRLMDNERVISERENSNPGESYYDVMKRDHCLTGYMTDLQNWVDEEGNLSPYIERRNFIDLSSSRDPVLVLQQQMNLSMKDTNVTSRIRYISLAKCNLKRVPTMFQLQDSGGRALHSTMEYLTLYGNEFSDVSTAGEQFGEHLNATNAHQVVDMAVRKPVTSPWTAGFQQVIFLKLRELDLRNCRIQQLNDNIFINMPHLKALYLSENNVVFVSVNAFAGLRNLMHLDLSRNSDKDDKVMVFEHENVFSHLRNLVSLDFSMSIIAPRGVMQFKIGGEQLERLSLCHTGVSQLPSYFFNDTALRYLDLSGNNGVLSAPNVLSGLEDTLEVLYAKEVGLKNFDIFYKFCNLQLLNLENNDVSQVTRTVTRSLKSLKILDLRKNRLTTWFQPIFGQTKLQFLSLTENNINLISEQMLNDVQNISFVGFSGNFIVCNCHTRELYELAYRNQNKTKPSFGTLQRQPQGPFSFHSGFVDFDSIVSNRQYISKMCQNQPNTSCPESEDLESDGNFQLFDYDKSGYKCLMIAQAKSVLVSEVDTCIQTRKDDWVATIEDGWNKLLLLLIIPGVLFLVLIMLYIYRRNLWYFCITMRNTATLSLINNGTVVDECTIFNYDVFVSYCNEDRNWVLDHLIPHVEKDCNVSVCLHERDFQVGLSILENIVSCMDRSRAIMLVISQRFLLSQWCQFEMHLAQHRLLETRREDLILVLLEEIPRRMRPTTLHYLMLTKTYIVWPKNESEYPAFWKRLMRSLIAQRLKTPDNISLV